MVARRGLVAPQNFFLDSVIRRCNNTESSFILANAQICDYPIVYCNEGFSKMIGYSRAETMQKNASLSFMYSDHTDSSAIQKIQNALENAKTEQVEIGLCKKNKTNVWLLMNISPIMGSAGNDVVGVGGGHSETAEKKAASAKVGGSSGGDFKNKVVLYLCQFKDITPLKEPLEGENNKILGLSRILQIARVAKYRQQFTPNHIETKDLKPAQSIIGSNFNQSSFIIPQFGTGQILALTFYTAFMVPFNIAFRHRDPTPLGFKIITSLNLFNVKGIDYVILLDSVVDVIFFADILLNFHTTFVGPVGEVVIDPKAIRHNYFKSWFLIDLLSCLPYDIFYMFKQDDERIASLFSALKVVRLLRLGRVARKLDNYLEYGAATLLLLLCAYVLVAHWMACIWYVIGEYEARNKFHFLNEQTLADGWLIRLSYDLKMPFNSSASNLSRLIGGPDKTHCYVSSLYFTMSCMSTVGFGNIASTTMNEKIFGICMMIISALLYAAIFGHMTTIIQQMTSSTQRYHQMISDVREFIRLQEIPKDLAEKVVDYIVSTWTISKGIESNKVLGFCPKDMRADICVHMNRKVFNEHICFKLMSDGCDLLYHTGESVDALWFVVQGSLEVKQDDEVVAILGKGDVFGDEFWKHNRTGQSSCMVQALTYSDLHFIKREPLLQVLSFYKPFANSLARNLVLTYNLTNRIKFRKVLDVKREQELEERRKIEKLEIATDHPIRKLLQRMQERHAGARIASTRAEEEIHLVQNEINTIMEHGNSLDGNCDGGSERIEMSGVLNKLSRLERMLETLIGKQMEEDRYLHTPLAVPKLTTTDHQQQHQIPQCALIPPINDPNIPPKYYLNSFASTPHGERNNSNNTLLYRSTLRNASKLRRTSTSRDRSLSMEKGGGDQEESQKPQIIPQTKLTTPQIPPLRLNDEPTTIAQQSSHLLANHKQQGQRQSIFRQQSKEVPSLERCPCCNISPSSSTFERQHIISPFTSKTHNVPQIHIEQGWAENVEDGGGTTGSEGELLPQTSDSQGKAPPIRKR
uniref:Potassium voltage-gated channel protein eag n=1 Tax=Meloidogyne hapla TaxID=6305 RepID=A0A1I8BEB9_MELHA